jgi:hypothetical protein
VAVCSRGACLIGSCEGEFRDCDGDPSNGCEISIADDPAHCGGCRQACALDRAVTLTCGAGYACAAETCAEGYGDCDGVADNGCETLTRTEQDCGGCSQPCAGLAHATSSNCATGSCRVTQCEAGFLDCDGVGDNGCEEADVPTACGCDQSVDSDGDGTLDCIDQCDDDPQKAMAGVCGCGLSEADLDGDGEADCLDLCDDDPLKSEPGQCGCGVADTDGDGDETADCLDGCPRDPTAQGDCFPFAHSNFDSDPIDWSGEPVTTIDCGNTTIDTTDPDGSGPQVATITGWCGVLPTPVAQLQPGGPGIVVLPLRGLTVASGRTLTVVGSRPLVLAVRGNVSIAGTVSASANGTTPGSGGNLSCTPAPASGQGGNGSGSYRRWPNEPNAGASGGGGGGFGSAGGSGGRSDTDGNGCGNCAGGSGGATRGNATLVPLIGGCPGGRAGGCSTDGGGGGGALQLTASGSLTVSGTLRANGGAGAAGCGNADENGGTGGGSGGSLLLEASSVNLTGATFAAAGGQGGQNGDFAGAFGCGGRAGGNGSTNPSASGGNGAGCQGGGSGGGGGYGRRRVNSFGSCTACP